MDQSFQIKWPLALQSSSLVPQKDQVHMDVTSGSASINDMISRRLGVVPIFETYPGVQMGTFGIKPGPHLHQSIHHSDQVRIVPQISEMELKPESILGFELFFTALWHTKTCFSGRPSGPQFLLRCQHR